MFFPKGLVFYEGFHRAEYRGLDTQISAVCF